MSTASGTSVEHFSAVRVDTDQVLLVDKQTAQVKQLAAVPVPLITGLAYDHESHLLYATDAESRLLVTIDPAAGGATTIVGNMQVVEPYAAAIDPADGTLYVIGQDSQVWPGESILYTVDKATGAATEVGPTGFAYISGLDFDPASGVLYGSVRDLYDEGALLSIDTGSGLATQLVTTRGFTTISFDENGVLYGVDPQAFCLLYTIDVATGACSYVGNTVVDRILAAVFDSTIPTAVEQLSWGRVKASYQSSE